MSKLFLTTEDMKMCFSLLWCVYGIGTLGMPGKLAGAGKREKHIFMSSVVKNSLLILQG
ncbi:hypothetical protein H310_15312 [Aphanomyces invadans]|uniref:Uncharacterized protein n=1 Tax=Aphanomyces invadans TaxID=157072 RepID=A0A024T7N7_9STRA|nr:hypothetical protein H310_15312 [Aphanomyces invadans]ETV89849.1 hypothetical protein H310_15312 [Aphanomyces invadans]|eukprot:XP_008881519.1 hypothetical protein H310_15312 [Aphanomyces invadans]